MLKGTQLICIFIKEGRSFQKRGPAIFCGAGVGGGGEEGNNGDYDNVAASVIVCAWELIAVMQAAA